MSSEISSLVQMTIALAGVLALAGLSLAALRRLLAGRSPGGGPQAHMRSVATLPLGERRFLTLVEVGRERMVVGVTPHSVNLIARDLKLDVPEIQAKPAATVSLWAQLARHAGWRS